MVAPEGFNAGDPGGREARIAEVVEEVIRRREAGEGLPDDAVIAAHPDLTPELAEGLEMVARIRGARQRAADTLGPETRMESEIGQEPPACEGPAAPCIEGYEIVRLLHAGGQGLVYQAVQRSTRRKVAIKVPLTGQYASQSARRRFDREIELVAQLRHPNIVTVFDSGVSADGVRYFVMDYVRGVQLTEHVRRNKLDLRGTLKLFATVCQAVQYANQRGVIHRDLKPSNILVDPEGNPKVVDFGLARVVSGAGETLHSVTGQVIGTLPYISPEQARGIPEEIDIQTDVYSLGVVLYELLTGRYPYPVDGPMADVLRQISEASPTPPSRAWRSGSGVPASSAQGRRFRRLSCPIDNEVQTIVLKALSKERERRYQSAGLLAQDIEHYLRGEPIEAKKDSAFYLLKKTATRHKVPVAAAMLFVIVVSSALVVSLAFWHEAVDERNIANEQRRVAQENLQRAKEAETKATHEAERARNAAQDARVAQLAAEGALKDAYYSTISLAEYAHLEHNQVLLQKALQQCPARLRGWEWYFLRSLTDHGELTIADQKGWVTSAVFSPDGKAILAATANLNPFSRIKAGTGDVVLWDSATGKKIRTLTEDDGPALRACYSPGGDRIAAGFYDDRPIKVWDATTGHLLQTLAGQEGFVVSVAFSRDGRRIVSGGGNRGLRPDAAREGYMKVWDTESGKEVLSFPKQEGWVWSAAFSPDSKRIVSAGGSWPEVKPSPIRVWDALTGKQLLLLKGHQDAVLSVSFSPDGKRILSASFDKTVRLWEATTGQEVLAFRGHKSAVSSAVFHPDGRLVASCSTPRQLLQPGSADNTVRIWDSLTGVENVILPGHDHGVVCAAFSPDGRRVLSGGFDKTLRVWSAGPRQEGRVLRGHSDAVIGVSVDPSGTRIASGSFDRTVRIWDIATGQSVRTLTGHTDRVLSVSFSPDGTLIASTGSDRTVRLWDARSGKVLHVLEGHAEEVLSVRFSPSGRRIASGGTDNVVKVWDSASGAELLSLRGHQGEVDGIAFSPDEKRLVSASSDKTARIWDAQTGKSLLRPMGHEADLGSVAFSPDGRQIATGSDDGTIRIWNAATGEALRTLKGLESRIACLAYNPDGTRLAAGTASSLAGGVLKLWDPETGRDVLTLRGHLNNVQSVVFTPDGKKIISGSYDKTIRIWEADSAK